MRRKYIRKKPQQDDFGAKYLPTQEEIRVACEKIRASWTPEILAIRSRSGLQRVEIVFHTLKDPRGFRKSMHDS